MAMLGSPIHVWSHSQEDETHFLRFGTGILCVSTEALRDYFNQRHPNLSDDLFKKRTLLERLKEKKVITSAQWDLLYPACGKLDGIMQTMNFGYIYT